MSSGSDAEVADDPALDDRYVVGEAILCELVVQEPSPDGPGLAD
jgi:hypothetical protein